MLSDHEMTMVFFYHSKLFGFDGIDNKAVPYQVKKEGPSEICYTGVQTTTKGFVIFKGPTTLINIHFKPTGFFHIFNIRPAELVDKMGDCEDILSGEIVSLQDKMHAAGTIQEAVNILEQYLIRKMSSQNTKYRHKSISHVADFLIKQQGMYSIKKLAYHCNMTIQTFEVQFLEQVGINPKYFSRILRFVLATNIKLYQPFKSWTEIANMCGYYDQAHFIKEFKEFAFVSPKKYMLTMNPIFENFEGYH